MRIRLLVGVLALAVVGVAGSAAADVTVAMQNGRVTVVAQNAQLKQILAEWARVGQTKIVGAEKLSGPPITLQLQDVPERLALETLLRAASGYMAAPRAVPAANASLFDRILILPTSTAPAATAAGGRGNPAPLAPRPAQIQQAPAVQPENDAVSLDDEEATEEVPLEGGADVDYANPQQMLQRRQQQMRQQQGPTGAPSPGASRPGMMMPAPAPAGPAVFPGTATPQLTAPGGPDGVSGRPGEIAPVTPQPGVGPYGLPAGVQPGSAVSPSMPPDRSKYLNPYQPVPPKPPGG